MLRTIKRHLPDTKSTWKAYFKIFLPIIAGSMMFALNGVIDNFMVGHLNQGQAALGSINSWTTILTGFFLGTAAAGSVAMAQFYHAKKYDVVQQVSRIRFLLSMTVALGFALVAWTDPEILAKVFLKKTKGGSSVNYLIALENATKYAKVIAIQWLLISFSFNLGNQLRELGHGKVTMFWGMGTLGANIILNSVLMYGFHMGVEGAAWASVSGRLVAITTGVIFINVKKIPIMLNPLTIFNSPIKIFKSKKVFIWIWKIPIMINLATIFNISNEAWKIFLKRTVYAISIFTVTFFIVFRNYFYSVGYPNDSLGIGVSGMSVVSLTGAIINVFTVIFNSLSAMAAVFVGSELGKGNLKQARINSDRLKGFNALNAIFLSCILSIFGSLIPEMTFLSAASGTENTKQLLQVSHSIYVIAVFFPIWIWFSTSYRNASTGGKGHWFSVADWIIGGPIQLAWLAVLMLVIAPNSSLMTDQFAFSYFLFFLSDFIKLIVQEVLYYKYHWENSITEEEADTEVIVSQEHVDVENLHE